MKRVFDFFFVANTALLTPEMAIIDPTNAATMNMIPNMPTF
ncbi:hypothetical protein [Candidatus Nitrosocosmicus sp. SS]|nr:hypothetical protein [Candidatus Nitrosocosmicus sp. SS]